MTDQVIKAEELTRIVHELLEVLRGVTIPYENLVMEETCDHEVGICWCRDHRVIKEAHEVLRKYERI